MSTKNNHLIVLFYFYTERSQQMKKILSILLLGMTAASLLIGCSSAATEDNSAANGNQVTETIEYTSLNEDKTHTFDEEVVKDDGTYILKDVTYETVSSTPVKETQTLEIKDLYEQNAETEAEPVHSFINTKGQTVQGELSGIAYSDTMITNRTTEVESTTQSGYVISQPAAASSKTVNYADEPSGQTVTAVLPLTDFRVTVPYHWEPDVTVPMRVEVYDSTFYMLNGRYVPYNDEKPALAGYETDILTVLNLPQESYRITDFVWTGDVYTENGVQYRNAVATGERYVAEYTAYYSDTVALPDANGYNATLTYSLDSGDTEYIIKAAAVYEKEESFPVVTVVITVVSILVGIIAIVLILFLIAKKRKTNKEN